MSIQHSAFSVKSSIQLQLFVAAFLVVSWACCFADGVSVEESKILASTVSMFTRQIIGYAYDAPVWESGKNEPGKPGQGRQKPSLDATRHENDVRAVALGVENGYCVFFTLRSFVDPFFPSAVLQGLPNSLMTNTGEEVYCAPGKLAEYYEENVRQHAPEEVASHPYIRYAVLQLTWYADRGGGASEIIDKKEFCLTFDPNPPKNHSGKKFGILKEKQEEYLGAFYPRPHKDVSVAQHFFMQTMGGMTIRDLAANDNLVHVRFFDMHDVALLYVPMADDMKSIHTLQLAHPTLACDLVLRRPEYLFGFKFNLIGRETLQKIQEHQCAATRDALDITLSESLYALVGMALDPMTLNMLRRVDHVIRKELGRRFSEDEVISLDKVWNYYSSLEPGILFAIGKELAEDFFEE